MDVFFAEFVQLLWEKGYDLCFCGSGNPDQEEYKFYIPLSHDYEFDFPPLPLKNGWSYCRHVYSTSYSLYYTMPSSVEKKLKKDRKDIEKYFLDQRALLTQWIQNIPPTRIADYHKTLRGHSKSHSTERTEK